MRLLWEEEAWEDYCLWQTRDKKLLKRINSLIKDIQRNTYEGIGKPRASALANRAKLSISTQRQPRSSRSSSQ